MKYLNEIKIGIFVIASLVLLLVGWAFLREFAIHKQNKVTVVFDDVAGLIKGSFVRINGLRVGRVDGLTLDIKQNKVLVEARIQLPAIVLPKDSKFYIRTSGYVGDKYLDIALGTSHEYLRNGDVILGEATFDSFKSLERATEIINEVDPKLLGLTIQEFATGASSFLKKADALIEDTDKVVKGLPTGADLQKLILNARETTSKLHEAINTVEKLATNELAQKNIVKLLSQANEVSSDLKSALDNANNLANNKVAFENVNNLLIRASRIIEQLDEIKSDPLIQNELRETLTNANAAARDVSMTSRELSDALHQRFLLPRLWFGKLLPKKNKDDKVESFGK